jgi:hypothetical protein
MILKLKILKVVLALLFTATSFLSAFAQAPNEYAPKSSGPREQLAITIFAGLGGAVLGLSTLSFYDRPQDHLVNIAIGFAVGVIGGTIYSTYQMATKPYNVSDIHGFGHDELTTKLRGNAPANYLNANLVTLNF